MLLELSLIIDIEDIGDVLIFLPFIIVEKACCVDGIRIIDGIEEAVMLFLANFNDERRIIVRRPRTNLVIAVIEDDIFLCD